MKTAALTLCATMGEAERPMIRAAAHQLSAAVSAVLGSPWPVSVVAADCADGVPPGSIWIASLIEDVRRSERIEATMQRWRERIEGWSRHGAPRILLTTLFRSVPLSTDDQTSLERLRRLNRMAIALSCETGIEIVDIDRLFSWCGARSLETDYRCRGQRAAELGGHAIAAAIFAAGLDDFLPADVQENANKQHGGILDVAAIFQRRTSMP